MDQDDFFNFDPFQSQPQLNIQSLDVLDKPPQINAIQRGDSQIGAH